MNILVTGCLGHIGSYLINILLKKKNIKVIGIDSNANNTLNTIFKINKKNFKFYLEDLNFFNFKHKIKKIDVIVHLASTTNAEMSLNNKNQYEKNNISCLKKVVQIAQYYNSKLLHLSSTSIYGVSSNLVNEELEKKYLKPQSPYAKIKLYEENFLKRTKINYTTLRFGTIVGASSGMRFHTAVNKFCLSAKYNKPITVWKSAYNQYRPYLSLRDATKTLIFFIDNTKFFNKEIYNVVTNNFTVREILFKIKKLFNKKIKVKYVNSKIMNQLSYKVSNEKIRKIGINLSSNIDVDIENTKKFLS